MSTTNPQLDLIQQEQQMQALLAASTSRVQSYYSEANTVFCLGGDCLGGNSSVWTDGENNDTSPFILKEDPDTGLYYFEFLWEPGSIREGDYYLCYTYTPLEGGDKITDYIHFYVTANIQSEVAIPTHQTLPQKYQKLLDAYTPEMYKLTYTAGDKSVSTISNLNSSVAKGFTNIEDQANRIIDLLDANVTPEQYLKFLANYFGTKLTTRDPTRWRGQIKSAIPLNKEKGTLKGLKKALGLSGMVLNGYYQYWQINSSLGTSSPYFWTESFVFETTYSFKLQKVALAKNDNFELSIMKPATIEISRKFDDVNLNKVNFTNINGQTFMEWVGENLEVGTIIKITYQLKTLTAEKKILYEYFKTLDYQDTRDVQFCDYPPKNWNIRLIQEDDSYFPFLVPVKNAFSDPTVFGQIRTMFPYSENIYNMDEYNGSLRDSFDPKDIAKDFVEPCSGGISSHFLLDISIENLSDFSLQECQALVNDYTPFHSIFCHILFNGTLSDYVLPPDENLDILVDYLYDDFMLAGTGQRIFTRGVSSYLLNGYVNRDDLASSLGVVASGTLEIYNDTVNIVALDPAIRFSDLGISNDDTKVVLKINSPSVYAGIYVNAVEEAFNNGIRIKEGVFAETPKVLNSTFNFSLYNNLLNANVTVQDNSTYSLSAENLGVFLKDNKVITKYDVDKGETLAPWKVQLNSTLYTIAYINNNFIYLINDGSLLRGTETNKSFSVIDTVTNEIKYTTENGTYQSCTFAKVTPTTGNNFNNLAVLCNLVKNYKVVLKDSFDDEYQFIKFLDDEQQSFLIDGYEAPFAPTTISAAILLVLIDNKAGRFTYSGMKVKKPVSWPAFNNPATYVLRSGKFPENYILKLTSGTDSYYKLSLRDAEFDPASSLYVHIDGKFLTCGTTATSAPTTIAYELLEYKVEEDPAALTTYNGDKLYYYTRSGSEVTKMKQYPFNGSTFGVAGFAPDVPLPSGNVINTEVQVRDGITFTIEYLEGEKVQGEIK